MIKDYWVHIPPHLSDVLAELGGVSEDADFDTIINAGRTRLFNFNYPVSQTDKQALEEFILNYYITRRIGSGNVKKWRQYLKGKMLEIMPYYKQLLDSEKLTFEPLLNNDITTTDDATGTLDQTNDKRTDNDYTYEKEGTEQGEYTRDVVNTDTNKTVLAESGEYTKDATTTDNGTESKTENGEYEKSGTENGSYSKSGMETTNSTEVNRYSDTPQGDSSRIWEIDAQGNPVLTDIYLTDIRGITNNTNRNYSETGTDSKTTGETGTDEKTATGSHSNTNVLDEEGTNEKNSTTDFTDRSVTDEDGTNARQWDENGNDQRDIVEHETIDQDTTHSNTNVHIGVSNQSKSSLLNEYRETFLRIYGMIAEELEPLFYNLVEIDDILDFVY